VQRAILAGDAETGVMVMQMEAGLDTGPVRANARTPIDRKTAGELTDELARLGAKLMVDVLADIDNHPAVAQLEEGVTYAQKIEKSEARLDFNQSAEVVERQVRAYNPVPGAFFEYQGERYRVLAADIVDIDGTSGTTIDDELVIACATNAIRPTIIQRAGKPAMPLADFLRGNRIPAGTVLS
jgi:methionyl-tRNA formyltransferase